MIYLYQLNESVDAELWINFYQQVYMIRHNLKFQYLGLTLSNYVLYNFFQSGITTVY